MITLDSETAKQLETNVLARLEKVYSEDNLVSTMNKAVLKTIIITLQEYEKLNMSQE